MPFEDASAIERIADRHDAGFICFGNHNKKRPNNMIIHRLYNHQILDMLEVGIEELKTLQDFGNCASIEVGQQPILIFQGDAFDLSENFIRFKNMMIDFFRIKHLTELNILSAQRIITFTAKSTDGNIVMQHFEAPKVSEALAGQGQIEVKEIGPKIAMKVRRVKNPDREAWKAATKVAKSKAKQLDKKRNISYNELGQKLGKAFIQHQDLSTLALKKQKRRKVTEGQTGANESEAKNEKPTDNDSDFD